MKRFALGYERCARVVLMLLTLHAAMIVHTVMGCVVAGFFPALGACCATVRAWLLDERDRSWTVRHTWGVFHASWRSDLLAANMIGWPQALLGGLLIWECWFVWRNRVSYARGYAIVMLVLVVVFALVSANIWVLRSHFDESAGWIVRHAIAFVVARPLHTLMVVLSLCSVAVLYWYLPGFVVALGCTPVVFLVFGCAYSWGRIPGMSVREIERAPRRPGAFGARHAANQR